MILQSWKRHNYIVSKRGKSNIAIALMKKQTFCQNLFLILGASILFLLTVGLLEIEQARHCLFLDEIQTFYVVYNDLFRTQVFLNTQKSSGILAEFFRRHSFMNCFDEGRIFGYASNPIIHTLLRNIIISCNNFSS